MTQSGIALGTPEYMAPEQARGHQRELGPSADIFSLGCVFYECLTGQQAFFGDHIAAVLAKILIQEAPQIHTLWPQVPPQIDSLVARMLAKDPRQRPTDAAALLKELVAFGELPSNALGTPARADCVARQDSLADGEQLLFSVVVAAPPSTYVPGSGDRPFTSLYRIPEQAIHQGSLHRALAELGAQSEMLADGTLVAALTETGSATDQVAQAARVALRIVDRWPAAHVALATGRGVPSQRMPVGEAIDRAVRLVRACEAEASRGTLSESTRPIPKGVWLDGVSAGLLDARFTVVRSQRGPLLQREDIDVDQSRPLLGRPTPCLGREYELRVLDSALASCIEESGPRVVLVTAPPGIGKSRLRHEFLRRVRARPLDVEILQGRGEPLRLGSPYALLSQALRQQCNLRGDEPPALQRTRLAACLTRYVAATDAQRVAEFLGELCQLPFPDATSVKLRAARNDPKIMFDQVSRAFLDWLRAECSQRPVIIILEDLHWGDVLTTRLLNAALRELQDKPFLVLALARPEVWQQFPKLWSEQHLQELRLPPLPLKASQRLVNEVLGSEVSPEAVARIVEQAAGNPLYLEELIRVQAEGNGDAPPETVLAILISRIARLNAGARRVLRGASLFGSRFWPSGVRALYRSTESDEELANCLSLLVDAEIIEPRHDSRFPGEVEYAFRHTLMRDAAYSMLTEEDRPLGHRLVAAYLERLGETDAMVLAQHLRGGGDLSRALDYYLRAAEQCYRGYDSQGTLQRAEAGVAYGAQGEALGQLRALQCLAYFWRADWADAFPVGQEALTLLPAGGFWWCTAMANLFIIAGNLNRPEKMQELYTRFASVQPAPDARGPYIVCASRLLVMFSQLGQSEPAHELRERMIQAGHGLIEHDAAARGDLMYGHGGNAWMLSSDPWLAHTLVEQSVLAFRQAEDLRSLILAETVFGMMQAELGASAAGETTIRSSLAQAEKLGESFLICDAKLYLATVLAGQTASLQLDDASRLASSVVELNMSPTYTGLARSVLSQILRQQGRLALAEEQARIALPMLMMMPPFQLIAYINLIRAVLAQGRATEAHALAEEALLVAIKLAGSIFREVSLQLAIAEARHAAGDVAGAHEALAEALRQLQLRASRIPDPAQREKFLTLVPDNARTQELARTWLGHGEPA